MKSEATDLKESGKGYMGGGLSREEREWRNVVIVL